MKRWPVYLVAVILALVIVAFLIIHSAYPKTVVDATTLGLLGLLILVMLIPFAKSITLPGGGGVNLLDEFASAKVAADQATKEQQQKGQARSLAPMKPHEPSWRNFLDVDANIALAGLRIEIEERVRELAHKRGIVGDRDLSTTRVILRRLQSEGVLTDSEHHAIESVVNACNQAVHATEIPSNAAYLASDVGETALKILDQKLSAPLE